MQENKYDKYLPLGSVVILKGAKKRIMITGYCPINKSDDANNKVFDYSGCLYPEGFIASDKILMFDHSQIERIFCIGYSDEEQKQFATNLKKLIEEMNTNNTNN